MFDIIIVGAGIVGSMIARKLSKYDLDILVIEKENDVGNVTTTANSAIIHSGYDPLPGTLKAKLNVLGNKQFDQLAKELDVKFIRNGSITLCLDKEDLPILDELYKRSQINGVESHILEKEELLKLEPNISDNVIKGLYFPSAGIIDPFNLCIHAMENACENGVKLHLNEKVINIKKEGDYFNLITSRSNYNSKIIINCAGYFSDEIASFIEDIDFKIIPRKGEYFVLDHFDDNYLKHTLFTLPTSKGKGVLISPTSSNNYIVGPSSEESLKDDFSCDKYTLDKVKEDALKMVKYIPFNQQIRTFSGIRATPSSHDFIIQSSKIDKYFINVCGIESPGLAASPAIADYVIENLISPLINLKEKSNYNPYVRPYIRFNELSLEEQDKLIKQDKDFACMVCYCEKVTLGEIKDNLNRYVKPLTIKAIKKRTRAGFGKCQGGFCQGSVIEILASYFNKSVFDILYDKDGSNLLYYETKVGDKNE